MNAFLQRSNSLENIYAEKRHTLYKESSKVFTAALQYLRAEDWTQIKLLSDGDDDTGQNTPILGNKHYRV